ncbi:MAG: HeH/LEM domain-containing protein [Alistipes senegalensis]|nr:HeH/LEM domain-containing protein [Oxalobacter formigenes]MCM1280910.1 HeH/LEM domain-containing protein [Alistipes senegalensis]
MRKTIELGAPKLTGKDCNDLVAEAFSNAVYPLKVTFQNHAPRNVSLPEVDGLFLRHAASKEGTQATVMVASYDLFQRVTSSIEQIAELNGYEKAVTVSADVPEAGGKTAKPSDGLTVEQLKEVLKAKGIGFAPNAKKSDLADLLDNTPEPGVNMPEAGGETADSPDADTNQ